MNLKGSQYFIFFDGQITGKTPNLESVKPFIKVILYETWFKYK